NIRIASATSVAPRCGMRSSAFLSNITRCKGRKRPPPVRDDDEDDELEFLACQRATGTLPPIKTKARAQDHRSVRDGADMVGGASCQGYQHTASVRAGLATVSGVEDQEQHLPAHERAAAGGAPQHEIQNAAGAGGGGTDPGPKGGQ